MLTTDQLTTVRTALLDHIANQESPTVRPKFKSCQFKNGFLTLACADADTASWLETTAPTLVPWEGAKLRTYRSDDLPKPLVFMGYFRDSAETTDEKILRLIQNQNDGFSTQAWRVCRRNVIGKTVELLLEVDQQSASLVSAQNFQLNFKFGIARLRQVGRGRTNDAKGGTNSAAQARTVRAVIPSGSTQPPPAQREHANARTVQRNPRKTMTQQPPSIRNPKQSYKPPAAASRTSASSRLQQIRSAGASLKTAHLSNDAAGNRRPLPGSSTDPAEDGKSAS